MIRARCSGQAGFALPEILVSIFLLAIALVGVTAAITSAKRSELVSQRAEAAVHIGQQEMEILRATAYDQLKLPSAPMPPSPADPLSPDSRVTPAGELMLPASVVAGGREQLVTPATQPAGTAGVPLTKNVTSGALWFQIHYYVTFRDEVCAQQGGRDVCAGTAESKRLTIAVVGVTSDGITRVRNAPPYWMSSVVVDPEQG